MTLISRATQTPVLVATGTGGVGKTTLSCALAIAIAHEKNARVLVITIDPAQRLASVLCEEDLTHTPSRVDHSHLVDNAQGELYAAMIDTQAGWNEIVSRYTKSESDAQRIFDNKLYNNLTSRFSHSHDFVAMDQLYEHYRSGEYDYIILDTPPTSQAFGFFDAPQAMSEFFGGKLVRLVTSPYRLGRGRAAKLFDMASQPFFALADKILGKDFLNEIGEFFFLFHTMYDDFADRAKDITHFITSSKVSAAVITNPSQYITGFHIDVADGLRERSVATKNVIINSVPFTMEQASGVRDYLQQDAPDSIIHNLLNSDLSDHDHVYEQLGKNDRGPDDYRRVHEAAIVRAVATTEQERLRELVLYVQNQAANDDTI